MSDFKGFSVVKIGVSIPIASGLRLSAARRIVEQLNGEGKGTYKLQEDWTGVPVSHVDERKKF